MAGVLVYKEDVLRLVCGNAPQCGRSWKKNSLYMMSRKASWVCIVWVIQLCTWVTLMDMWVDRLDGFYGGYGVGLRNLEGRMLLELYLKKELCMPDAWIVRD